MVTFTFFLYRLSKSPAWGQRWVAPGRATLPPSACPTGSQLIGSRQAVRWLSVVLRAPALTPRVVLWPWSDLLCFSPFEGQKPSRR